MGLLTFIEASIKLGIPMVALSWVIFTWLYGDGDLDRKADRKSIGLQVKKMKKSFRKKKHGGNANYIVEKWMWFGSGFYGLAGLWTFVVIELADIVRVIFNPSRIIEIFEQGFVSAIVDILINQFSNLITAFVWFGYWADDGILIWLFVAYAGYWIGVEVARRDEDLQIQESLRKLRAQISNWQ